jgi:hypothetical protein
MVMDKDSQCEMDEANRIQRRREEMNIWIIASLIDMSKEDKLILSKRVVTRNEKN